MSKLISPRNISIKVFNLIEKNTELFFSGYFKPEKTASFTFKIFFKIETLFFVSFIF